LTKGPVALALVLVPVLALQVLDLRCARASVGAWGLLLLVALGLAAPWYVAVALEVPDFAGEFFWRHNVVRFAAPFDHAKPAWFYLPNLLLGLFPWVLLLPGLVSLLLRRSARAGARRPGALGFYLLCFAWCATFFSLAGCKRATYVLPAFPPLALALGCYLAQRAPSWRALLGRGSPLATHAAGLALLAAAGVAGAAGVYKLLRPELALALAGLAGLALATLGLSKRWLSWAGCAGVVLVLLTAGVHYLQPAYNRQFALRGPLRRTVQGARPRGLHVLCYPQRWDSVSFYLPTAQVRVYPPGRRRQLLEDLRDRPGGLLLVKSGKDLERLLADLPPGVEFVTRGRPGAVTVGHVRARVELPAGMMARR
jgi:4-amino-4-deoxy-L-arabinose transferase-like glycosyltransferase